MFEEEIKQLILQRQNVNDVELLKTLQKGFSQIHDNQVFTPFSISDHWKPEIVQPVLNLIDPRLVAYPGDSGTIISI